MHRRAFLMGAASVPLMAVLPVQVIAAPLVHSGVRFTPAVYTGSVAWNATADEMIAELQASYIASVSA